ncbi:MAG: 6-phosphofructokinase, partial [Hungatella sp.]
MLTSGGDCQSLNATMRGVAKSLYKIFDDVEIVGFKDGYRGLIYADYRVMQPSDFSGILTEGGTILGTSRQPFKLMKVLGDDGFNKVEAMKHTYEKLKLECLVVLGGNGSQKTANMLREEGLNIVSLPKTIDNDLWGSEMTFGFHSAVEVA